jgi:hypothetical protein
MVHDQALVFALARSLTTSSNEWRTSLVLWELRQELRQASADEKLALDGVFALENEPEQEAYAVFIPNLLQTSPDLALRQICLVLESALKPQNVADFLQQNKDVFISPFSCLDNGYQFPQTAPIITDLTKLPGGRFSAMLLGHPQLVPGESLILYFAETSQFFVNSNNYFCALCADKDRVLIQCFILAKELTPEQTSTLQPTTVPECGSVFQFAELVAQQTKQHVD